MNAECDDPCEKVTNRIESSLGEFHLKLRVSKRESNVTGVDKKRGRDESARCAGAVPSLAIMTIN